MRNAAEWLLLPLFLLPLLAGGGVVLGAREAQRTRLEPYRSDARARVRAWLTPPEGAAAWMLDRVARAYLPGGSGTGDAADYVRVEHPRASPRVRLPGHELGEAAWILVEALPEGLPVSALADPAVRLELESGIPAATLDAVDAATTELARLLEVPDLDRLRRAALSASTKAFVLRRWRQAGHDVPGRDDAERLVEVVRRWERGLLAGAEPAAVGARTLDGLLVVETGTSSPVLLPQGGRGLPVQVFTESAGDAEGVRLHWVFPPDAPTAMEELWRGEVDTPLAGTFAFTPSAGTGWTGAPLVRRFGPLVAAALLVFLALPAFLLVAMRRRRRLDEARVRFINEMAHDLRTPLTSLRLHADLVTQGKGKPERKDAYLRTIARESARLSELLENLLDIARLERGRRVFDLGEVPLAPLVDQVVAAHAQLRPERADDVRVEGAPDTLVRADRPALARILANLLDNAGKFTAPGTPIGISWRGRGDRVVVDVHDDGPGIPPEERRHVFARYARGERAQRDGLPGSGLGLALALELVEGMGGTVELLDVDVGTTFRLDLPGASLA